VPAPRYNQGASVEVILNKRKRTFHIGTMVDIYWPFKAHKRFYLLEENIKVLNRRYFEDELRAT